MLSLAFERVVVKYIAKNNCTIDGFDFTFTDIAVGATYNRLVFSIWVWHDLVIMHIIYDIFYAHICYIILFISFFLFLKLPIINILLVNILNQ